MTRLMHSHTSLYRSLLSFAVLPADCYVDQFVFEPHIAPALEEWAENFLERRRARRNRGAAAVPVSSRRRRRPNSNSSSTSSSNGDSSSVRGSGAGRGQGSGNVEGPDTFELGDIVAREVDQWRNEVLKSQGMSGEGQGGLRRRHVAGEEPGMFDGMSTSLDESFPSLTHTPLAPTHVISNISSPITATTTATAAHTPSSLNLPLIPTPISPQAGNRAEHNDAEGNTRPRSDSQSTTTLRETVFIAPDSLSPRSLSPILSSTISFFPVTPQHNSRSPTHMGTNRDGEADDDTLAPHAAVAAASSPVSIPTPSNSTFQGSSFPRTPIGEAEGDDSPFGPILPEVPTPGSADRPFSPIGRVMGGLGSSAFSFSTIVGGDATSTRPLSTAEGARRSSLVHEISARLEHGSGIDELQTREHGHGVDDARTAHSRLALVDGHGGEVSSRTEAEEHTSGLEDSHGNGPRYVIGDASIISSLSERYPIPPSPPVVLSPPTSSSSSSHAILSSPLSASSHEVISAPTSPSAANADAIDIDIVLSPPLGSARSSDGVISIPSSRSASPRSRPYQGLFSSLSTLQVPHVRAHTGARSGSRSRPQSPGATGFSPSQESSPTPSFASFLSPMSAARTVSGSEAGEAEFMSFVDSDEEEEVVAPRQDNAPLAPSGSTSTTTFVSAPTSASVARQPPALDRTHNPFLDFEDVMEDDGSEGSDESDEESGDGSHGSEGSDDGSWGSDGSARWH
ncbi:hypothetical protein F5I97DRAFT_1858961 [Phlebopus sp. FC_14]|nr:hypothetical protein F5I97DRAFT_1858961 [Phlebopus sp. FC_14]